MSSQPTLLSPAMIEEIKKLIKSSQPTLTNRLSELSPAMIEEINKLIDSLAASGKGNNDVKDAILPQIVSLNKQIHSLTRLMMYDDDDEDDAESE